MLDELMLETAEKMDKAIEVAREEFGHIRSGRANAAMFNSILVDYYGAPTPLQQVASVTVPEARTVLISPYDRSALAAIDKAIRESDLGVNPTDDGAVLRVVMPALTEERRRDYVKLAKTKAEDAKVAVRSVRRKTKDGIDKMVKDGEIGEDEGSRTEKELEELTKKHVDMVDKLLAAKEQELLEV